MEYVLGFVCGFFAVFIVSYITKRILRKRGTFGHTENGSQYDERQILARGKAFKYGYFATMFGCILQLYLEQYVEQFFTRQVMVFSVILIGVLVFVSICIFRDAYLGLSEKPIPVICLFLVISVINFIPSITDVVKRGTLLNKEGVFSDINFLCGCLLLIVALLIIIKSFFLNACEDGDEHEES